MFYYVVPLCVYKKKQKIYIIYIIYINVCYLAYAKISGNNTKNGAKNSPNFFKSQNFLFLKLEFKKVDLEKFYYFPNWLLNFGK